MLFEQLDYLYAPSRDVAKEAQYFADVPGGRLVFAVEGMGARVAMVELANGSPHLLLADHLDGDRPSSSTGSKTWARRQPSSGSEA